ncbi:PaaI family thioesterase [Bradyrhizobium sp. 41S5]|uniref:PaaI family thioesterase n=1 Tax=Bradyrhizobium sp. 41S5 TaxID=1404443 RepID=UPI00156AD1AF|nr:PaaI family thioesterase [Bradyrhizobium sp. 41S5]UFX45119.1 PaaI family thioesterase [Bradyrhizobium sp. 41S5]
MRDIAEQMMRRAVEDERQEFGSFFLSRFFGLEIAYQGETCIVSFDVERPMFNPQGTLHGGVLATALDISMGHLVDHIAGAGTTLEMKVQYLAAVREGRVTCHATFLKRGRKNFFLQSQASAAAGEPIAHATSTWQLLSRG